MVSKKASLGGASVESKSAVANREPESDLLHNGAAHMRKLLAIAGLILLMTDCALAQSGPDPAQCAQVKQAVAQYGYREARRHAMANYGPQAVNAAEKCLTKRDRLPNKSVTTKPRPVT